MYLVNDERCVNFFFAAKSFQDESSPFSTSPSNPEEGGMEEDTVAGALASGPATPSALEDLDDSVVEAELAQLNRNAEMKKGSSGGNGGDGGQMMTSSTPQPTSSSATPTTSSASSTPKPLQLTQSVAAAADESAEEHDSFHLESPPAGITAAARSELVFVPTKYPLNNLLILFPLHTYSKQMEIS